MAAASKLFNFHQLILHNHHKTNLNEATRGLSIILLLMIQSVYLILYIVSFTVTICIESVFLSPYTIWHKYWKLNQSVQWNIHITYSIYESPIFQQDPCVNSEYFRNMQEYFKICLNSYTVCVVTALHVAHTCPNPCALSLTYSSELLY